MPQDLNITVYKVTELSDDAKEKALAWWREVEAEFLNESVFNDAVASLEAFVTEIQRLTADLHTSNEHFEIRDYNLNVYSSTVELRQPEAFEHINADTIISDLGLFAKLLKDADTCPFTGLYYDAVLLDALADTAHGPRYSLYDLLEDAVNELCKAVTDEAYSRLEDDALIDGLEANGIYFLESGKPAPLA